MSEHFVKYINIKKYKCFSDFSAEGFKRVNLISGKNNVGKTALLEAVRLCSRCNDASTFLQILVGIVYNRYHFDYLEKLDDAETLWKNLKQHIIDQANSLEISSNLTSISYFSENAALGDLYKIIINDKPAVDFKSSDLHLKDILPTDLEDTGSTNIATSGFSARMLVHCFTSIQKKDREDDINHYLRSFDSAIENVKIIGGDSIQCKIIDESTDGEYRDINELGDGFRQYLAVIFAIFRSENRYLYIDEVDGGIHYTSLDKLWEIILTLSKELNVQVFATTHSQECIESYCRVAEKLQDKDISFTTLVRNKEKQVKAIVRDYEVFTDSIHDNREVRGW